MVSGSSTPSIDAIVARMQENPVKVALIWRGTDYTYERFLASIEVWKDRLQEDGVGKRDVCAFQGDFSPQTCALLFALMSKFSHSLYSIRSQIVLFWQPLGLPTERGKPRLVWKSITLSWKPCCLRNFNTSSLVITLSFWWASCWDYNFWFRLW